MSTLFLILFVFYVNIYTMHMKGEKIMLMFLLLLFNFFISWGNASYCGRYWSESKAVGGSFRLYVISGYVMAVAGLTMVYWYVLALALPYVLPIFIELSENDLMKIMQLSSDMTYILLVLAIVPTGFIIWFRSVANFWERKTLGNGIIAGYNTFAQAHNTINACRELPSAFSRVTSFLFDGDDDDDIKGKLIAIAIILILVALLAGYFTASAIMKKADREYDALAKL